MNLVLDDVMEVLHGTFLNPFSFPSFLSISSHFPPSYFISPHSPNSSKSIPSTSQYIYFKKINKCLYISYSNEKKTPPDDEGNQSSRPLGLIVARGTLLVMISPKDGSEEIENPFLNVGAD
jgi:small nuclear ribonucleoprotein (snRNP)-like protein